MILPPLVFPVYTYIKYKYVFETNVSLPDPHNLHSGQALLPKLQLERMVIFEQFQTVLVL